MLAKFPGKCSSCGKAITVGVDEYDYETKTSWHRECLERPSEEAHALAESLGYKRWDEL